jgi:MSHA biogenesis protein MshQ
MLYVSRSVAAAVLVTGCTFTPPDPANPDPAPGADAAGADPGAWLRPWERRKAITLSAAEIEAPMDDALVDFPVLVSVTDPEIAASALRSGEDLVFTAGDGTTVLASEIESFTPGSEQLVAWVKVPRLPATSDTTLYVYYGNPSPPAQTPEAVWAADHLAVWHLQQDPGPGGADEIRDATGGEHDGTADAQMEPDDSVPAQVGRGIRFDGASDALSFGSMNVGNAFTISMWVEFAGGSNVKTLLANSIHGRDSNGFRFFVNTVSQADRKLVFETGAGFLSSGRTAQTNEAAVAVGAFTHVAVVVDRTAATVRFFVNGMPAPASTSITNNFQTSSDLEVARMENVVLHFPGTLDEIQVARAMRDPEWIRTSFHNQSRPGSFHTLGAEERAP